MHIATITFISFGLAMDAFAASITRGIIASKVNWRNTLVTALLFGSFQGFMPLVGWYAGSLAENLIVKVDHWVAFGLLGFIGTQMIYEGFSDDGRQECESERRDLEVFSLSTLLVLAVATSIDALATGISFSCLKVEILFPVFLIGIITFTLSFVGVRMGRRCEGWIGQRARILGGLILIGIGTKILLTHLGLFPFC